MKTNLLQLKINRRQWLVRTAQTTAGCALGSLTAPMQGAPLNRSQPTGERNLTIGMATLGFPNFSHAELAQKLSAAGIQVIQLFLSQTDSQFWKYNSRADVSALTPSRCRAIADAYRQAGIAIHSLGVYTNLIHPDATERQANLDYFEDMMKVGSFLGVRTFITEAGHYHDATQPEPNIPLHFQDAVWPQTVATVRELAARAAKFDAKVLLEPFYRGFLASAKRTRLFLEDVNSPRIRALLDPANLIEVNDLEEMFQQLGPWIDCLHAKDRKLHTAQGVGAGEGDLNYPEFVKLAMQHTPHAPLILEYVGPEDYMNALAHLRKTMRQAEIKEQRSS